VNVGSDSMPASRLVGAYLTEAKLESTRLLRTPAFVVPTLLFPLLFYALFGLVIFNRSGDPVAAAILFTNYCAFGAMAPGIFGFGITLAMEREQGVLLLKRALPMPLGAHLIAKMLMAALFVAIVVASLCAAGIIFGHVQLRTSQYLAVALTSVFGVLPFCAIGFLIGTLATGQSAPAIANLVYLPMSFLSGIWVPLSVLPKALQSDAPIWPTYHLIHLMRGMADLPHSGSVLTHFTVLLGVTVGFTLFAIRRLAHAG
jgi:ABC-2 type transport system permease protein